MNDTQKEFEAWAKSEYGDTINLEFSYVTYMSDEVDGFWTAWQECDKLNKERMAKLEADIETLSSLLSEARDDVCSQLNDYQNLLPYKKHRYDAQKDFLDKIDNALINHKGVTT